MIRLLIAEIGCGKTFKIKQEIITKKNTTIFVITDYPSEYLEYEVQTIKPNEDFAFLTDAKNCSIYIDAEDYIKDFPESFMQTVVQIVKTARMNNNDVTFVRTFINEDLTDYEISIFNNVDTLLIGKISERTAKQIEKLFCTFVPEKYYLDGVTDFYEIAKGYTTWS